MPVPSVPWLLMVLALASPFPVCAQFTFTTNNGTITVTGYTGTNPMVVVPSTTNGFPVTSIGISAFEYKTFTSITIPGSVTNLGDNAFRNCGSLSNVFLSDGLARIGNGAFSFCPKLVQLAIPNSVTFVGDSAFSATALTNIVVPANVAYVGPGAFAA